MCLKQSYTSKPAVAASLLANANPSVHRLTDTQQQSAPVCFPSSVPVTVGTDSCAPVTLIRDNQPLTENGWMDGTFPLHYTRGAVVSCWMCQQASGCNEDSFNSPPKSSWSQLAKVDIDRPKKSPESLVLDWFLAPAFRCVWSWHVHA